MSIYKKILVAVDSSEEAIQVLQAARELPDLDGAEVSVLHVAEHPQAAYGQWLVYLPISESQLQGKLLDRLNERVKQAGLKATNTMVEFGRPVSGILDYASKKQIDLIVVGSHGRHGIKLVLGNTANGVLHRAECDVLSVRIIDS